MPDFLRPGQRDVTSAQVTASLNTALRLDLIRDWAIHGFDAWCVTDTLGELIELPGIPQAHMFILGLSAGAVGATMRAVPLPTGKTPT